MLFNSPIYIFAFLPVVVLCYILCNKNGYRTLGKAWLVICSLFFYGYWNPYYLVLIIGSIVVNFAVGNWLQRSFGESDDALSLPRKKVVAFGVLFNVALLAYYKYADFFIDNINLLSGFEIGLLQIALPLAISFFTFQQIAYLVDSYREKTHHYNFLDYSLFVSFFPQLIAGPIVHHKQMMPQFLAQENTLVNWSNITAGVTIFFIGLFKKVIIADTFAIWANAGFDSSAALTFFEAWGASLSYTFQLYYDFSGYTDMAIGAALLFNIRLPINFNSPYKATNVQDFWRRWHITLSNWLRDYVYIFMGGNRVGKVRIYFNLFLTFVIGGLWHGAGWTFVIWGALHGGALVVHRLWTQLGMRLNLFLGWLLTFSFVSISWVFFRAESLSRATSILRSMVDLDSLAISKNFAGLIAYLSPAIFPQITTFQAESFVNIYTIEHMMIFGIAALALPNSVQIIGYSSNKGNTIFKPSISSAFLMSIVVFCAVSSYFGNTSPTKFLYFNF